MNRYKQRCCFADPIAPRRSSSRNCATRFQPRSSFKMSQNFPATEDRKDGDYIDVRDAGLVYQNVYGVSVRVASGRDLMAADVMGKSDPYCVVNIDGVSRKTKICKGTLNPEWNEDLTFMLPAKPKQLHLRCLDWDKVGKSDPLGDGYVTLSTLPDNGVWDDWLVLIGVKTGAIKLRIQITVIPKAVGQTDAFAGVNPRHIISMMDLKVIGARNLKSMDTFSKSDPYATVHFNNVSFKSHMVNNTNTPTWDFKCPIWITKSSAQHVVKLSIYDSDTVKDRHMGNAYIRPSSFEMNKSYDLWIPLTNDDPKTDAQLSALFQTLRFDVDHPETAADAVATHEKHPQIHLQVIMKEKNKVEAEFVDRLIADYDSDKSGTIEIEELIHLAQTIGSKMSDEELNKMFIQHDSSGTGKWGPKDILAFLQSPSTNEGDFVDRLLSVMIHGPHSVMRLLNQTNDSVDNDNTKVLVQDRESGIIVHENIPIYIKSAMRLLYRTVGGRAASKPVLRTMKNLTMKAGNKMDNPRSKKDIPGFIRLHKLDVNEIEKPVEEYQTFNEFFYRKLRPGSRICAALDDPKIAVSPADCRMMVFDTIQESQELWIKGKHFTLSNLFGKWDTDGSKAAQFNGGSLVIARLAPQDYHRFHYPVTGKTGNRFLIPGEYNTVNPIAIRKPVDVYTDNKRVICPIQTHEFGLVVMIAVAATMVGSIGFDSKENVDVNKFDPAGYFAFGGSTNLVVFRPGSIRFDSDLSANSKRQLETLVKVGSSLGTATNPGKYS